jgi:hypothetical protein
LLQLEDKLGKVSRGLTEEQIKKLQTVTYMGGAVARGYDADSDNLCTICFSEFTKGEKINKLQCNHLFHLECIKNWLLQEKKCPVCKEELAVPE